MSREQHDRRVKMFDGIQAFNKTIEGFSEGMNIEEVEFLLLAVNGWRKILIAARDSKPVDKIEIIN